MKKIIFILTLVLVSLQTNASHLMGGQITTRNVGGLDYEITLTLYRDVLGIPMGIDESIIILNPSGSIYSVLTINTPTPVWIINGIEKYVYTSTFTFPSSGSYTLAFSNCCRNMSIVNLFTPDSQGLYLDNVLEVHPSNSSPIFMNDPISVAQVGIPFTYNPLPFDSDGDSLVWVMDTPMNDISDPIPGFYLPPSDTSMPFTLNANTGEISFLPTTVGVYEISIMAKEYRNGVHIGYIRRDMQLNVIPSSNIPPVVSTNVQVQRTSTIVNPGQTFTFIFDANDPDSLNIDAHVYGDFLMGNNVPIVYVHSQTSSDVRAEIVWTPTVNEVRSRPYIFCCRVSEQYGNITFFHDYTYSIKVETFNSTDEILGDNVLNIYPNPISEKFHFDYDKKDKPILSLLNTNGQIVLQSVMEYGSNEVNVTTLPSGVYHVMSTNGLINTVIKK